MSAPVTRSRWLSDCEYFAGELIHCLEQLQRCEPAAPLRSSWVTSSALVRRVRAEIRRARELEREASRRELRLQESRR